MTQFDSALDWIFRAEGGWANIPGDRGGPTRYGISSVAFPHVDLETLTREEAAAIYRRVFWYGMHCDELYYEHVRLLLFDCAVLFGVPGATRVVQYVLGVKADGVFGPVTLQALKWAVPSNLVEGVLKRRLRFHLLQAQQPDQSQFLHGWLNRLLELSLRM